MVTACSGGAPLGGTNGAAIRTATATTLPATVAGLQVQRETVRSSLKSVRNSYLDAMSFYTLREHTNVEATIEIAHFARQARTQDPKFVDQVVRGVVGNVSTPVLVHGTQVQQTAGLKSTISVWFRGNELFVLTVLQTYPRARGLLEAVVAQVNNAA
jgi:hypothetical protein